MTIPVSASAKRYNQKHASLVFLFVLFFIFGSLTSSAQYKLLWEKPLQLHEDLQQAGEITGISPLDEGYLVLFRLEDFDISFPGFAFIDKNDRVYASQYINIDSLENVILLGAMRKSDTEVKVMGNDYTDRGDGKPIPLPFEIVLEKSRTDTVCKLLRLGLTSVTNLSGDRSFAVTDNAGDGSYGQYLSVVKRNASNASRGFIYALATGQTPRNTQFDDVRYAKVWYADKKVVVASTETAFNNNDFFYQIHVMDHDLKVIRSYPSKDAAVVKASRPPGTGDRLVRLTYKPIQNIGFVTRQVTNANKEKVLGWYVFNGLSTTNPVFLQAGIDGNVQPTTGPVIPDNEEVITDGDLHTGLLQVNHLVVAVDYNPVGSNHDLVLTVADDYGLETSRQVIKGYIDSSLTRVEAWTNDNNQLYVVASTPKSLTDGQPGLYISKWEATPDAINNTLDKIMTTMNWSATPFFSKVPIADNDKTNYVILGIDSSDANYSIRDQLIGKTFKLQKGGLQPLKNSYWFRGTIKVGKKTYELSKFAIAK